jgi:hypothetical protein
MNPTDLRIGNLVLIGKEVNILELVDFADIYENNTIIHFEPIPLTEEWLLNMGFDKAINGWFCSKEYLWLMQNKLNNQWFANVNGIGNIDCKRIDYVHSLQNLYFALTGEELTFSTSKTS